MKIKRVFSILLSLFGANCLAQDLATDLKSQIGDDTKTPPFSLDVLSGIEDGFGLDVRYSPDLGEYWDMDLHSNLLTEPDDSNLDFIKFSVGYKAKKLFAWNLSNHSEYRRTEALRKGSPIMESSRFFVPNASDEELTVIVSQMLSEVTFKDRVSPHFDFKFASTQDFENVEYGLAAGFHWNSFLLGDHPASPFRIGQQFFNLLGADSPRILTPRAPTLGIEYQLIRSDLQDMQEEEKNRLAFFVDAAWEVPIADKLEVVYEGVYDFDSGDYFDYVVAKVVFYEFEGSPFGKLLGTGSAEGNVGLYYKYGELAPTFETGDEIGLGFSIKL